VATENALQWDGSAGHYEVYYVTFTDPATGVGVWIRYTMVAPLPSVGEPASASLWFLAMDPRPQSRGAFGRKVSYPVAELEAGSDPFSLRIGEATLTDDGMKGAFEDVEWDLRWRPGRAYQHVHPMLRGIASTILVLPHADVAIEGSVGFGGRRLELADTRGGQAHLWGSKHAARWAWVHCNDFQTPDGEPVPDTFIDGVSVFVPRFGREIGPNTPFVGRIAGHDFVSTSGLRVLRNASEFGLQHWRFEAVDGDRKLIGEVDADRDLLGGVTYHDPDGELAHCYNSEAASLRLELHERSGRLGGWSHTSTLLAPGHAHFEYAQRAPLPDMGLLTK
jgi:hypothetical protein